MIKFVDAGSWQGGGMEQPARLIKISSRGLIGNDRAEFLKIASHVFADALDLLRPSSDEIPIHLNAVGASEFYGPNRNGDGFTEKTCRDHHTSFVKDARYYKNHQNKDPAKSYGRVKRSAYNERMGRIELLVFGNKTKEAAERNGGLVLDDTTISALEQGNLVPWSMACKIAYDRCVNCHNKAANRSQYCTEETCISPDTGRRGFGCKMGLTKVASDGFIQYVDNPDPLWFDISQVVRPADRIAHGGLADYMQKAAGLDYVPGGAELAELWSVHEPGLTLLSPAETIFNHRLQKQAALARELADYERQFERSHTSSDLAIAPGLMVEAFELPPHVKLADCLGALALQQIPLPLGTFLKLAAPKEDQVALREKVAQHLPCLFGRLTNQPGLEQLLQTNAFATGEALPPLRLRDWAEKQAADCSLARRHLNARLVKQAFRPLRVSYADAFIKTAGSGSQTAEALAQQYGLSLLAFLAAAEKTAGMEFDYLKRNVVRRNYLQG